MQLSHTTNRRRPRTAAPRILFAVGALLMGAGVLSPSGASAEPGTAAEAMDRVRQAAQELTVLDEQVHQAEITVDQQHQAAQAAAAAAAEAQAAVDEYEPLLRAIATSGYTGENQSRVAAFLTSESATELVQQMTTLDMIAAHTNQVIAHVDALKDAADEAQRIAGEAAALADAGLAELRAQQAAVQQRIDQYEADFARLTAEEQAAVLTAVAGPTLSAPSTAELPVAPGSAAAIAIDTALAQVGDPYAWGASGPDEFDCSGLTLYAYAAAGVSLPHSSRSQSQLGMHVPRNALQPGDLVFFYEPVSHVGLYIGDGMMVHARTHGSPVAVTTVDQNGFRFGRRIVGG